jgi:hypothetical protein
MTKSGKTSIVLTRFAGIGAATIISGAVAQSRLPPRLQLCQHKRRSCFGNDLQ